MSIAIRSRGDVRAAINDLQSLSKLETSELIREIGDRDKEQTIFQTLQYIFKNSKIDDRMINIFDELNVPIDEVFLWIEENIPIEYKGAELARAFEALSLADVYRGRTRRQRNYRFMVYEYFLLGPAIACAKKYNRTGWTSYKKPTRILKIWLQNQRAAKKKSISQKFARHTHVSTKTAMREFAILKFILKNGDIRKKLKLSEEEIAYLDNPA